MAIQIRIVQLHVVLALAVNIAQAEPDVRFARMLLTEEFQSEGAAVADIDGDGNADIVSGPYWYSGPEFKSRHAYATLPAAPNIKGYSAYFFTWPLDVDRDGHVDIVTVGMPGQPAWWHQNPGTRAGRQSDWPRHKILDDVGGESPALTDINGDGRPDLVCVHAGGFGFAVQAEDRSAPWTFTSISGNQRLGVFTHGMGVGDVDGDGRMDLLETRGWWRQGEKPGDPFEFRPQRFAQGGGAQMYAYDFDGDGDNDVLSVQNAHGWGLTWFERRGTGEDFLFVPHPILTDKRSDHPQGVAVSQMHSVALADLDGDGIKDVVTGKRFWAHGGNDPGAQELPVLYWLRTNRRESGVDFETRLLDERMGVGTQLTVADVTGDGRKDIVVGNKLGTFVVYADEQGRAPAASPDKVRDQVGTDLFRSHIRATEPLTPDEEQKSFVLPPGFEAQLFAAEPQIAKPMNLAFDNQGRLWVSSSEEYPLAALEDGQGRDTIKILEDTDGDGRADRTTTFADNLNIPMGLYPYGDGVICFSIPDILLLRDTDGDGRADVRKRLYGPFDCTRDTHGMCNGFTRGNDGWIYACHGFNNQSAVAGADGHEIQMRSGNVFRFRADGSRIEHVGHGQVNPFGLTFDHFGDVLTADCHTKPINLVLPGGWHDSFGAPHDGLGYVPNVMEHLHGSTGIGGIALGSSLRFPQTYFNSTFGGNVVTGRVNRNRLVRINGTLRAVEEPDFMISGDPWFRPVDLQPGPDGALYVADFYNRIIGHYEVKLDHPGRDRHRGRIWRIVRRDGGQRRDAGPADVQPVVNLAKTSVGDCFRALNGAGPDQVRRLVNYLVDEHPSEAAELARREAAAGRMSAGSMWILFRTNLLGDYLDVALRSRSADLRAQTLRAIGQLKQAPTSWIERGLKDPHPEVRRAAAIAASRHVDPALVEPLLLTDLAAQPRSHLRHAVRIALKAHLGNPSLFRAVAANPDYEQLLAEVCLALKTPVAGDFVAKRLMRIAPDDRQRLVEFATFAARWASTDTTAALAEAIEKQFAEDVDQQLKLLASVHDGLSQRGAVSDEVTAWALRLARGLIAEGKAAGDPIPWNYVPAGPRPNQQNCWVLSKRRKSADGMEATPLFSSFPLGERRTGIYRSRPFTPGDSFHFYVAGHDGFPDKPLQGRNVVRLRAAASHEVLRTAQAPRNDTAQHVRWDTSAFSQKLVYLELVDTDDANAFAWLAVGRFSEPRLNPSEKASRRQQAATVVERFRLRELHREMAEQLVSKGGRGVVTAAAQALAAIHDDSRLRAVAATFAVGGLDEESRQLAVAALVNGELGQVDKVIGAAMGAATAQQQSQVAGHLLGDRPGLDVLLSVVQAGRASATLLARPRALQQIDAIASPDQRMLAERLVREAPSEPDRIAQRIAERSRDYLQTPGDRGRGTALFEKNCAVCHQVAGKGKKVGPNLDGIGNRGLRRLVEDLLAPNRNVDVAFRATLIVTEDGVALSGALKSDEGAQVVLIDPKGKEIAVAKTNIARRKKSVLSPMPENFVDTLSPQQFRDLMAYLLSLRK